MISRLMVSTWLLGFSIPFDTTHKTLETLPCRRPLAFSLRHVEVVVSKGLNSDKQGIIYAT